MKNTTWVTIENYLKHGNPAASHRVEKTEEEWKNILTEEEFYVTRKHGTERPGSGLYCKSYDPGIYVCKCCKTKLFNSETKFESGTGWPSFTEPLEDNVIQYVLDSSLMGRDRVETRCNICDAHLGHVFPDGPEPTGLRYCMNSVALEKFQKEEDVHERIETLIIGGGCFWCTEAMFIGLRGVLSAESGYSGGSTKNPSYKEVCSGETGHAECIRITYNPEIIHFSDLIDIHLHSHDPTTLNQQGGDIGTQYRFVIFYKTDEEKNTIQQRIAEAQKDMLRPIVTQIAPETIFYKAEDYHQNYFELNKDKNPYCSSVVSVKLKKMRDKYRNRLK
jgi:peptide methionine sulfoxide reductase msrA/msrB